MTERDIENSKIVYRENLGLNSEDNFGMRIGLKPTIYQESDLALFMSSKFGSKWKFNSLNPEGTSSLKTPLLTDSKEDWHRFETVLEYCYRANIKFDNCTGKIRFDLSSLGNDKKSLLNFLKFWAAYEPAMLRFIYGERIIDSEEKARFYKNINEKLNYYISNDYDLNDISDIFNKKEKSLITFKKSLISGNDVIDLNIPNSTSNMVIWQNDVNFLQNMLYYAKSAKFDAALADYMRKNVSVKSYSSIDLGIANNIADQLFEDEISKNNFIIQYFKNIDNNDTKKLSRGFTNFK